MKLRFLGTRGSIEPSTQRHQRHSSPEASYYHNKIIIDCGADWQEKVNDWKANAILITHAHPDHAFGLKNGAPCPVYATEDAWQDMENFEIEKKCVIDEREKIKIPTDLEHFFEETAFPVLHSTRAPAVGHRLKAGQVSIFYGPDVAWIKARETALDDVALYIGVGAAVKRSMIRKPGDTIIAHAPIQTQLSWCQKTGVNWAVFTHLGSQIVAGKKIDFFPKSNIWQRNGTLIVSRLRKMI